MRSKDVDSGLGAVRTLVRLPLGPRPARKASLVSRAGSSGTCAMRSSPSSAIASKPRRQSARSVAAVSRLTASFRRARRPASTTSSAGSGARVARAETATIRAGVTERQEARRCRLSKSCSAWHVPSGLLTVLLLAIAGGAPVVAQTAPARDTAADIARLVAVYPTFLDRVDGNVLVWKDGTRMTIDDGRGAKDHETLLATADIKDMFFAAYPLGRTSGPPGRNADPGRARNVGLLQQDVRRLPGWRRRQQPGRRRLATEEMGQERKGDAHQRRRLEARRRVGRARCAALDNSTSSCSRRLEPMSAARSRGQRGSVRTAMALPSTSPPSPHTTGAGPGARPAPRFPIATRSRIEIVEIFERHGFIWGGKWYHYDTMHFEYRPELIGNPRRS